MLLSHENMPAEVLVFGQQNSFLHEGLVDHGSIDRPLACVHDHDGVMAGESQRTDDQIITTLVSKKTNRRHRLLGRLDDDHFVREHGGRIGECRPHVFGLQGRISVTQIAFRGSLAQLADDEFNQNPCALDHRLAPHDVNANFDAGVDHDDYGSEWSRSPTPQSGDEMDGLASELDSVLPYRI